jgi:hypothetical protein
MRSTADKSRVAQRRRQLKSDLRQNFGAARFSTFSTASALSDLTCGRTNVHTFVEYMVTDLLAQHFRSLIDYPPAQKGTTLSFDQMMEQLPKGKH